jgi:hypothetical protein
MMISDIIRLYLKRDRYLRGMTDSALSERLVHWLNNCTQLSPEVMVNLCATENPDFFHRLTDTVAETALRHRDVSAAQDREMWVPERNVMIKPSHETAAKIKQVQKLLSTERQGSLLRFGSKKYMQELYKTGGLLFQEASTFSRSDNLSIRDDELTLLMKRYIPKDQLHLVPGAPKPSEIEGSGFGLNIALSCPDFLVLCMTDTINFRLISDWNAEAVVIIHDATEFTKRLERCASPLVREAGAKGLECGKVRYIDPYFPLNQPDVPFCKHFKFAYQREFRFVIRGNKKVSFDQRKFEIGSLHDIASIIHFSS